MTVAYDGTDFNGFQIQDGRRTVQAVLEAAIGQVVQHDVRIAGAGRTDAGVHATGQVVSFQAATALPTASLRRAVNARLPEDVVIAEAAEAAADFHARYRARARGYRYTIWNGAVRSALDRRTAYHWRARLAERAMDEAAHALEGRRDFAAFAGTVQGRERPTSTVRTLYRFRCWREGDKVLVQAIADAFLPHMVRNLVGTLIPVGMGQRTVADVLEVLASRDRRLAGRTAPARGLCLTDVWY